jgi:hypothetical protein
MVEPQRAHKRRTVGSLGLDHRHPILLRYQQSIVSIFRQLGYYARSAYRSSVSQLICLYLETGGGFSKLREVAKIMLHLLFCNRSRI